MVNYLVPELVPGIEKRSGGMKSLYAEAAKLEVPLLRVVANRHEYCLHTKSRPPRPATG